MAGHYKELIDTDDVGKVTRIFEDAIALSFVTNKMRVITRAEVARRFDLCDKIFTTLRADLKWSIPKIADVLATYLKCELDGVPYSPEDMRSSWSPEAVERVHDVPRAPDLVVVDAHGLPLEGSELAALDARLQSGDTVSEPFAAGAAGAHEE